MNLIDHGGTALRFTWRILVRHRYAIVGIVAMVLSAWWLVGCTASTRIEPASNSAKVETNRTPASKTTRITIGGSDAVHSTRQANDSPGGAGTDAGGGVHGGPFQ